MFLHSISNLAEQNKNEVVENDLPSLPTSLGNGKKEKEKEKKKKEGEVTQPLWIKIYYIGETLEIQNAKIPLESTKAFSNAKELILHSDRFFFFFSFFICRSCLNRRLSPTTTFTMRFILI